MLKIELFSPTPIHFILTGGTIDNRYHQRLGRMVIGENVEKIIPTLRLPHHVFTTQRLFKIDSRDMEEKHRSRIAKEVVKSRVDRIIITHGTDTMVTTGRYLQEALRSPRSPWFHKTVVLTGAMVPHGVAGGTPAGKREDAVANVISAITLVGELPPGVWIVFHGRKINPRHAVKDYSRLTMVEE